MEQVRVNLTLEKEIWQAFTTLVPQRKKSKMINELLTHAYLSPALDILMTQ